MGLEDYAVLFISLVILAYKPGPGFFMTITYGVKEGLKPALAFVAGEAIICGTYFAISMQTAAFGAIFMDSFVILLKGLGSAFLIYMGLSTLQEGQPEAQDEKIRSLSPGFYHGAA